MTATTRMGATVVILTMVAVAAGVWIGMGIGARHLHHASSLDEILHHELNLTAEQKKHISALESNFVLDRQDSEMQMRAANLELARALEAEHGYGDGAKAAISHFHDAMAKLQEQTIRHVLDMRSVLTPEQANRFDQTVREALSSDPP